MPDLVSQRFDLSKLPLVESFSCGDDPFSCIASDWIRCVDQADSASQSIVERQTEVFLYFLEDAPPPHGKVVGFGSLGKATRKIRRAEEVWSIIPHIGVDQSFQGKPAGAHWYDRYAAKIMMDLMLRANDHKTPSLYLYVHQDNHKAIKLYGRLGFQQFGQVNGEGCLKMLIPLPCEPEASA